MNPAEAVKVRKRLNTYNMVAKLTWSVVCLLPVSVFCYSFLSGKLFCIFLLLSMLSVLLPKRFLNQLSVKRTKRFYQKAGVVFMENKAMWTFVIIITKIIYNFYPILLQHYHRMRLINLDKKNAYAKKTVAHSKAKPSSKPVVF